MKIRHASLRPATAIIQQLNNNMPMYLYICNMRIKPEIKIFIKETASKMFPEAELYLFGSRVDDQARGGDIDILILSAQKTDNKRLREFRIKFYKIFGWQKIDLVNLTRDDKSTFKKIIETNIQPI